MKTSFFDGAALFESSSPLPKYFHFAAVICEYYRAQPIGATLPPLTDLARRFSVSKETINRSMRLLAAKGFVKSERGRGTVILRDLGEALGLGGVEMMRAAISSPAPKSNPFAMVIRQRGTIPAPDFNLAEIEIVAGLQHRLQEDGRYLATLFIEDGSLHTLERYLQDRSQYAGFLFMVDMLKPNEATRINELGIPAVAINEEEYASLVTCVTANEEGGIGKAVQHLVELGHSNIAFLIDDERERHWPRVHGFQRAVEVIGGGIRGDLIMLPGESRMEAGERGKRTCQSVLENHGDFTAFVTPGPRLALGFCEGLGALGKQPGGRYSVVCFGYPEHEWNAIEDDQMKITNVVKPRYEMGRRAAEVLLAQVQGNFQQTGTIRLPCELLIGSTTSAP